VISTRTVPLVLLAAALLGGCGHGAAKRTRTAPSPNPIPTAAAKQATVHATSSISGVIAPFQNVAMTSSLSEPTDSVSVLEGDHVRIGQVLAVLDTADLQAQLAQANANVQSAIRTVESDEAKVTQTRFTQTLNIGQGGESVRSARAALNSAQVTLRNDTANLERDRALLDNGYVAQQTFDQQQTLVNTDASTQRTAQANLRSAIINEQVNGTASSGLQAANVQSAIADANAARAAVAQARAQSLQYQVSISKAKIMSPVNGIVVNRNLNPGEYPGSRTIFTIQQLNKVYAMLNASSADTFAIPVGAHVTLNVSGTTSRQYTGDVAAVLGQVTPGSTNFTVEVIVQNPDGKLQSGLPVTATASLPAVSGIGIPTAAFLDDTHTTVMVADDQLVDVVAKTVKVRELGSDGTTSIVSGLKAGQEVIANGQLGIADGQSLAQN
jgi:RND family efflux transporter MFP subunit